MDRESLIQEIERAFNGIDLGGGIGIHQAMALDDCVGSRALEKAKRKDDWTDWRDIPDELMEFGEAALCFMDAKGLLFALPAYMRYCIRYFDSSGWTTVDSPIYALARGAKAFGGDFSLLSEEQKAVIAKFLRVLVLESDDQVDTTVASTAYEEHWGQFDPDY